MVRIGGFGGKPAPALSGDQTWPQSPFSDRGRACWLSDLYEASARAVYTCARFIAPAPATVPIGHDPRKRQECQKKRAATGPPFCSLPLPIPLPLWGRVREGVFAQLLADRIEVYAALLS